MTSWFDIRRLEYPLTGLTDKWNAESFDQKSIRKSVDMIIKLLKKEIKLLGNSQNVYLGGFSQGCCISLATWILCDEVLGGIIGCSGVMCTNIDWDTVDIDKKNKTPVLLYHGTKDPLFNISWAREAIERLEKENL